MALRDQPKRILIVDDDEPSRFITRKIVEGMGHTVLDAVDVESGIALASAQAPHLILLDLVMPGLSGFDFMNRVRKNLTLSEIPIIVLSGNKDSDSIYRASALGAMDYLTKPIESRTLVQKISKAMQNVQYLTKIFDAQKRPRAVVHLKGKITSANEVGFLLEAPARVAEGTSIQLDSTFLRELDAQEAIFRRSDRVAKYLEQGLYLNEIAVIGLSPVSVAKIRKINRGHR